MDTARFWRTTGAWTAGAVGRTMAVLASALVWALAALGCGDNIEPPAPTGPMAVLVTDYGYAFDLESRRASVTVTMDVTGAGDCVSLPMRAQDLGDDLLLDGEPFAYAELLDDVLTVCGRGWEAGEKVDLHASVTVPLQTWEPSQVGYSVTTDLAGNPFTYMVSWVGGCDRFGPCDHAPDRFARYRFAIAHPAGTRVLCPGIIAGETRGDQGHTACAFAHDGGPTYSAFGFAASPSWDEIELGTWGGVRAVLYDAPGTGTAAALDTATHEAFFVWMQDQFGPYPYGDELRFATGPTYWSGFEHPGNIVLYDRLHTLPSLYADPLTHTTNHEIAHQWAGDQTTLADTYDFVWKEAMAEYLAFVFEDEVLDIQSTAAAWKALSRDALYYPVPGERPPLLDYYGDVYGPGPMVLFRQIEALFDREAVMTALRSLLGSERAIGVSDVQAALEDATGADLSGYFAAWVYGEGAPQRPVFDVIVTDIGGGDVEVTVRQQEPERGLFGCAFAIDLIGAAGARESVWFDLGVDGAAEQTVIGSPGFEVLNVSFDSGRHTLAQSAAQAARAAQAAPGARTNPWVVPR